MERSPMSNSSLEMVFTFHVTNLCQEIALLKANSPNKGTNLNYDSNYGQNFAMNLQNMKN